MNWATRIDVNSFRPCGFRLVLMIAASAILTLTPQGLAADEIQIDDWQIENAIEGELWGAKGVNANGIDLSVAQGVVTLSGSVNNILSKQTAVRLARMTKGVRSVVNQIEVDAVSRSDAEVRTDVVIALAEDPATESWEISVDVSAGRVTLDGSVESWAESDLAVKVAQSVRGVRSVTNNIDITYATDRPDSEIKFDIEQRLQWDVRLDDELVDVEVQDGDVTLSGTVGSAYERSLARADAWVSGVKSVEDQDLTVEWWSRDDMQRKTAWVDLDDGEIEDAVKDAFLYDPRVQSFQPNVSVESSVVTLTGVVDNLKAKRAAAQDAKNTVGVLRVRNYLKVRPLENRSDEAIREDVAAALLRDPFVDRFEITPTVLRGEVYLYGDVDSYYEKSQAESLAATVNGVTDVNNYLNVSYRYPLHDYDYYDWDPTLYDYDFDYSTTRVKPDSEIKDDIASQLWWSPWVDRDEVSISVDDGVATLTGTVDSWSERSKAGENAIEGGAVRVINHLDIDY